MKNDNSRESSVTEKANELMWESLERGRDQSPYVGVTGATQRPVTW